MAGITAGDVVRVLDENGESGRPRPEWAGQVAEVLGRDAVNITYAGYTETFNLIDGHSGSRYFLPRVVNGMNEDRDIPRFGADENDMDPEA